MASTAIEAVCKGSPGFSGYRTTWYTEVRDAGPMSSTAG